MLHRRKVQGQGEEATRGAPAVPIHRPRRTAAATLTTSPAKREKRAVAGSLTGISRGGRAEATRRPPWTHRLAVVTDRNRSCSDSRAKGRSGRIAPAQAPIDRPTVGPEDDPAVSNH